MWSLNIRIFLVIATAIAMDNAAIATGRIPPPYYSNGATMLPGEDIHGGIPMGVSDEECDDGKTNLNVDWDGSNSDFICPTEKWTSNWRMTAMASATKEHCDDYKDNPVHICMDRAIMYHDVIPTSGAHRPLWAKYGEYEFLPKQRWLHNLEHGAAVFLYHPCADSGGIEALKRVARSCMRKHIITPYKELTRKQPFAVLTYGCKLELPYVEPTRIHIFLKRHANTAPERLVSRDGQFDMGLIHHAKIVSDINDCEICPSESFEGCTQEYNPFEQALRATLSVNDRGRHH